MTVILGAGQLPPGMWLACEHPERPHQRGDTAFCANPCRACLVVAEMQLNLVDPTTQPGRAADWHQIISRLVAAP